MGRITKLQAEDAYKAIHALAADKRQITKEQAEYREVVKSYLAEHKEGFHVQLEDAREKVHTYHIHAPLVDRVTVDKESLRYQIKLSYENAGVLSYHIPKTITTAYLVRMVEEGRISADDVERCEDINTSSPIKKTKITGEVLQAVLAAENAAQAEAAAASEVVLGRTNATMTVLRGGITELHRPQVTKINNETGERTVTQEASVEVVNVSPEWRV